MFKILTIEIEMFCQLLSANVLTIVEMNTQFNRMFFKKY